VGLVATGRTCAVMGSYSDGNTIWEYSMVDYDGPPQEVNPSTKGT